MCFDGLEKRLNSQSVCLFNEFVKNVFLNQKQVFDPDSFFPGAFNYHLHLTKNSLNVVNFSYFDLFENYFYSMA